MTVLLLQTAAFWFMTGVTWMLQFLSYPLMKKIKPESFNLYLSEHNKRFGKLVLPGVLSSVITTGLLFRLHPATINLWIPVVQTLLLLIIVGSAAKYAAPAHNKLEQGFDSDTFHSVIVTNRLRLVAWALLSIGNLYLISLV